MIFVLVAVETALLSWACWWLNSLFYVTSAKSIVISFAFPLLYIMSGWFIRPEPDMDDLGWFGGMMNNPFSFSDDYNRSLLGLRMLLLPGQLLATPYAIALDRWRSRRRAQRLRGLPSDEFAAGPREEDRDEHIQGGRYRLDDDDG